LDCQVLCSEKFIAGLQDSHRAPVQGLALVPDGWLNVGLGVIGSAKKSGSRHLDTSEGHATSATVIKILLALPSNPLLVLRRRSHGM